MTNKNKHISEKEFQRYLNKQMTDAERNAFERELQKHPFEAEAQEGFQQISSNDLANDLLELHSEIASKKHRPRYRYWAAAATILLLVTSGILWFQLKDETPIPAITENKTVSKEDTTTESKIVPIQKSAVRNKIIINAGEESEDVAPEIKITIKPERLKEATSQEQEINTAKAPPVPKSETLSIVDNSVGIQSVMDTELPSQNPITDMKFMDNFENESSVEKISLMEIANTDDVAIKPVDSAGRSLSMKQNNFIKASVISDEQVLESIEPDVLNKPAFAKMELNTALPPTDTIRITSTIQDKSRASQIRIRGYAGPVTRKETNPTIDSNLNIDVQPKAGIELFEKYIELNAVIPDDHRKNREVIKLTVNFDKSGAITGFENRNNADSLLFEMAKKIITDGPDWNPEIKNGKPITSEKELRIVFRKKK